MHIVFSSTVPHGYHRTLERLVFFNRQQERTRGEIMRAVELYGQPRITSGAFGLSVTLDDCDGAQCLFAMTRRSNRMILLGMVLYVRPALEEVVIVHLALSSILSTGSTTRSQVVTRLVREVRTIANKVNAVDWIRLLYTGSRSFAVHPTARAV